MTWVFISEAQGRRSTPLMKCKPRCIYEEKGEGRTTRFHLTWVLENKCTFALIEYQDSNLLCLAGCIIIIDFFRSFFMRRRCLNDKLALIHSASDDIKQTLGPSLENKYLQEFFAFVVNRITIYSPTPWPMMILSLKRLSAFFLLESRRLDWLRWCLKSFWRVLTCE